MQRNVHISTLDTPCKKKVWRPYKRGKKYILQKDVPSSKHVFYQKKLFGNEGASQWTKTGLTKGVINGVNGRSRDKKNGVVKGL